MISLFWIFKDTCIPVFLIVSQVMMFAMGWNVAIFLFSLSKYSHPTLIFMYWLLNIFKVFYLVRICIPGLWGSFDISMGIGVALIFFGFSMCILGLRLCFPIYCFLFLTPSHLDQKISLFYISPSSLGLFWWWPLVQCMTGWSLSKPWWHWSWINRIVW